MLPSRKVAISIPTKGHVRAETMAWVLRRANAGCDVQLVVTPLPLPHARNAQVHRFLASDCTHLFTLDSDCVPPEDAIEKLLAYDLPVVVAPHASIIDGETGIMALDRVPGGYRQHHPMSGFQRCDAVGGSGLLIRRDVFDAIPSPWFMFEFDERGLLSRGEDFYFCEKLAAAGIEIWVDFGLVQRHHVGTVV